MVAWLAALSLVIGNLMALVQTNLKRMLAYSTISHVGFLFMDSPVPARRLCGSDVLCHQLQHHVGGGLRLNHSAHPGGFEAEDIDDFRGLWKQSPGYAFLILFVMASLAGVPPFLGFLAKLQVIQAALEGGYQWLAILAVVCAVIGAFYYLRLIRVMFFEKPEGEAAKIHPDNHLRAAFALNAVGIAGIGNFSNSLLSWCFKAFPAGLRRDL